MPEAMMTLAADTAGAVTVDDLWLNFAIGAVIPLLVGLVTRLDASAGLKAVMNFGFAAVASVGQQLIQGDALTSKELFVKVMTTWITSIMAYYGFQKPTGIAGSVAAATPNFGIGTPPAPVMETEDKGMEEIGEANLEMLGKDELYKLAQARDIKGRSKMTEAQLREALKS
jgi:uncharacterized protein YhaN